MHLCKHEPCASAVESELAASQHESGCYRLRPRAVGGSSTHALSDKPPLQPRKKSKAPLPTQLGDCGARPPIGGHALQLPRRWRHAAPRLGGLWGP